MASTKKKPVWFGMKLTPAEKKRIKRIARAKGVSQKEAIMNLVDASAAELEKDKAAGSLKTSLEKYCGVVDQAPADLSGNKNYLDDYGQNRLS